MLCADDENKTNMSHGAIIRTIDALMTANRDWLFRICTKNYQTDKTQGKDMVWENLALKCVLCLMTISILFYNMSDILENLFSIYWQVLFLWVLC